MIDFAKLITEEFTWDVYGRFDSPYGRKIVNKAEGYMNFHGYVSDVSHPLAQADFLVQLSNSEGMSYAMLEALQQRTAIIATPFPSAYEIIKEDSGEYTNGYILDFDLKNFTKLAQPIKRLKLKKYDDSHLVILWKKIITQQLG